MLMAEHKVPQDVEAEDKLIGPFSFRQFMFLLVALGAGFVAFFLGRISIPLALIPAPFSLFFLVIALPLRKDQPTEVYVAALVRYAFAPRLKVWQADGEKSTVEISAPIVDTSPKTKDLAGEEVSQRLSFLAKLSDTQGWSTRGMGVPVNNTNLNDDIASSVSNTPDILEEGNMSESLERKLDQSEVEARNRAINRMKQVATNQVLAKQAASKLQQTATMPVMPVPPVRPATQQPIPQLINHPIRQTAPPAQPVANAAYQLPANPVTATPTPNPGQAQYQIPQQPMMPVQQPVPMAPQQPQPISPPVQPQPPLPQPVQPPVDPVATGPQFHPIVPRVRQVQSANPAPEAAAASSPIPAKPAIMDQRISPSSPPPAAKPNPPAEKPKPGTIDIRLH
ncbi:hypothetical protein EUA63_04005 [TM7 phylum sp. oral taxon 348]|jgi:hypothetical protein|nr:hypothetical protein EUA63_04005 [TM7 phylum sp. oral taxon 348]TWP28603.1 hypothetical protein EUA62_00500 [TM7 phylum sp. oral taxon 348]